MFSKLRKIFVHSKKTRDLIFIVLVLEFVFIFPKAVNFLDSNNDAYFGAVLPAVLNLLANQNRQSVSLQNLKESTLLDQAAQLKANDMAKKGYFSHNSPDGKTPWYWFEQVGYKYNYAGENLAINYGESKDVSVAWMNSPGHRANILKQAYTEIGTGIATGIYNGTTTIFVVQLYGTPKITK